MLLRCKILPVQSNRHQISQNIEVKKKKILKPHQIVISDPIITVKMNGVLNRH